MSLQRHFLGWDAPALQRAVDFLYEEYGQADDWNLSQFVIVLPSSRAGRRLLELLALKVAEVQSRGLSLILQPPKIITPGALPELLYADSSRNCSVMQNTLARLASLTSGNQKELKCLFHPLPASNEPFEWLTLATEIEDLSQELAGAQISFEQVRDCCRARGLETSAQRWDCLANLQNRFEQTLADIGSSNCFTARKLATAKAPYRPNITVVLLATLEFPALTAQLLELSEAKILALIHAPESEAEGFDRYGRLVTAYWENKTIPIAEEDLHIVDRPNDQAHVVLQTMSRIPGLEPHHVTIGIGDETIGGALERALRLSGRPARQGIGLKLVDSGPAKLLSLLAEYQRDRSYTHFAALLRHPAIETWLLEKLISSGVIDPNEVPDWPSLCDEYHARRLPVIVEPEGAGEQLSEVLHALNGLWAEGAQARHALPFWAARLSEILVEIYGVREYDTTLLGNEVTTDALTALGGMLNDIEGLGAQSLFSTPANFGEAVNFVLGQAGNIPIPPPGDESTTDIVNWLEVHLDDAPVLFVTGFNDGLIPQTVVSSPFLPDGLRRELGLADNCHRYAQDAYILCAVLESRAKVVLTSCRLNSVGDQMMPSRLIFACDDQTLVHRTLRFYGGQNPSAPGVKLLPHGETNALAYLPRPVASHTPMEKMGVSAFRDYLSCPYRFYLKHVLGLKNVDDEADEMGGDVFGDLAHKALEEFGFWVLQKRKGALPTDSAFIEAFLHESLRRNANERFGANRPAVVTLQITHLERRLSDFARLQADESFAGWKIVRIEQKVQVIIQVDGIPFQLNGRIDRIDYHEGDGIYRIIDYKTGDADGAPRSKHLDKTGDKGWSDLQLPLYHRLAPQLGLANGKVHSGYITLPQEPGGSIFSAANWTEEELASASALADEIIRQLRAQIFWPPSENPPRFDDGLKEICLDSASDRAAIIVSRTGPNLVWPSPRQSLIELSTSAPDSEESDAS